MIIKVLGVEYEIESYENYMKNEKLGDLFICSEHETLNFEEVESYFESVGLNRNISLIKQIHIFNPESPTYIGEKEEIDMGVFGDVEIEMENIFEDTKIEIENIFEDIKEEVITDIVVRAYVIVYRALNTLCNIVIDYKVNTLI
ncbi:MAG: hypothetical protein ACRC30_08340 [Clostridium sp.]